MEYEIRAAKTRVSMQGKTLVGLAAPYGTPTEIKTPKGPFTEIIAPGAFDGVLKTNPDVVCTVNHDESLLLGRTTNGTLMLEADHRGLNFAVELPDSEYAKHVHENVKRGDLAGCSFGFVLSPENQMWDESDTGKLTRHITGFSQLRDVSVVTRPAYPGTEVDARGLNEASTETRSVVEQFVQRRAANHASVFKQTAEFVREQLSVPLFWDSRGTERPFEDQMVLMKMATDLYEMRCKGMNVEVLRDEKNWPRIVPVGVTATDATRQRRKQVINLLLD